MSSAVANVSLRTRRLGAIAEQARLVLPGSSPPCFDSALRRRLLLVSY
jgi:hypothetical protein